MTSYIYLSDIHGNFEALSQLVNLPEYKDDSVQFRFGGDYSDGFTLQPDSILNTWTFIKELCDKGKAQAILGNHDEWIIDAAYKPHKPTWWANNGRESTLDNLKISSRTDYEISEQLLYHHGDIMEWLQSLPLSLTDGQNILVHAGVELDKSLIDQSTTTLLWVREPYLFAQRYLSNKDIHDDFINKTLISGHTPTGNICGTHDCPIVYNNSLSVTRYYIDGGSKGGPNYQGRINLLHLDENGQEIWQKYLTKDGIFDY